MLATFWRQKTRASAYLRCELPARHLPGQVLDLQTSDVQPHPKTELCFPRQQGAAIWPFAANATRGLVMAGMQEQGIRVLMEVDDNYLKFHPSGDWQYEYDPVDDRHSVRAHTKIATWVDGVICATEPLAEAYRELNEHVFVCPNSVDPNDWPEPEKSDDEVFRIGWTASASHLVDVPLIRRALLWASKQPDVEVLVYGLDRIDWGFRVTQVPWTDSLADYRASLAALDVGVCPLLDNAFSRGKSDVKALEYAMAGAFPLCSDVAPYAPWKGRTEFARSAKEWERLVQWAVLHRDEIPKLAREAKDYVLRERTIQTNVDRWLEAIAA